ncbi:MAG TPA: ABC transporter ATP-binding protein [Candidatus Obscuribacterales bacterium]
MTRILGRFQVLKDISFSVSEREIVGIIGPNGAGKTTLMECIAGLQPINSGAVIVGGTAIKAQQRKQFVFYQPDQVLPYPEHGVMATLLFFRDIFGTGTSRMEKLIERLRLSQVLEKKVGELSRGFQKRLLLTLGLMSPRPIVLLDEPFEGLDVKQVKEVVSVLQEERDNGRCLILSIHQIIDAQRISDRLLLLNEGKVLGGGSLDDLRAKAGLPDGSLEDLFIALT